MSGGQLKSVYQQIGRAVGYDVHHRDVSAWFTTAALIIAESQAALKTMTVFMAVMEMDLAESQTIVFRNAAHGGLSVVYRRPDGNIGWIDPERTQTTNGGAGRSS